MPGDAPSYVIVGDGRWAGVIRDVVRGEGRRSSTVRETRRKVAESEQTFRTRIAHCLSQSGGQIAWVCLPPCDTVPLIVESAIAAGLHVVVEKPWLYSQADTEALVELAEKHRVIAAVHFQYCFLDEVERLRLLMGTAAGKVRFSGVFTVNRPDRLGIPALENLGSHLLAIREYAVPNSELLEIRCGYESEDERCVRVEGHSGEVVSVSLTTGEAIIQRFIAKFEEAIAEKNFPLNLQFAARVAKALQLLQRLRVTE